MFNCLFISFCTKTNDGNFYDAVVPVVERVHVGEAVIRKVSLGTQGTKNASASATSAHIVAFDADSDDDLPYMPIATLDAMPAEVLSLSDSDDEDDVDATAFRIDSLTMGGTMQVQILDDDDDDDGGGDGDDDGGGGLVRLDPHDSIVDLVPLSDSE